MSQKHWILSLMIKTQNLMERFYFSKFDEMNLVF